LSHRHAATALYPIASAARGSASMSLGARVAAFIRRRIQEHSFRTDSRIETMAMSDHELRDIGLRRTDLVAGLRAEIPSAYTLMELARFDRL
jgi:uncharacterized protein YjiS (DUF1127 family)